MKFLEKIFSIKNDKRCHKVVCILGLKFKFKKLSSNFKFIANKITFSFCNLKFAHRLKNDKLVQYSNYLNDLNFLYFLVEKTSPKRYFIEKTSFDFFKFYMLLRYIITKKIIVSHLEFKLTTKCTLNCKDCCHYAPYFKKQMPQITFDQYKYYLDELLKRVDLVHSISFMGGDGMLCKDLIKIIQYTLTKKQVMNCNFTSNGVLIPSDDLIKLIKNKKHFQFLISDYTENIELKNTINTEKIINICRSNNINYNIVRYKFWETPPYLDENALYDTNTLKCWMRNCKTYANGKIYLCPLQFFSDYNGLNIPIEDSEIIDIVNDNDIENKIFNFYVKTQYVFCKHCKLTNDKQIPVAIQIR